MDDENTPPTRDAVTPRVLHDSDKDITVELPSIGLGVMRTSATYAALLIQLEEGRQDRVDVLDSVMAALGIHPEEILHNRARPDCAYVEEFARWSNEADALRRRLGI